MEPLWLGDRLSWQLVVMVVAVTLLVVGADLAWRLSRMRTSRLAAILVPAGLAWLGGAWWLAGRLTA